MAMKLAVDDKKVFTVKVRESVSAMCEVMRATGRNRTEDYDRLCRKGSMLAVQVDEVFHLVGLPGILPLSKDCLEVVGPAKPGVVVEADSEAGFILRRA